MPYPPYYLQNFKLTPQHHEEFMDDELLYRRSSCPELIGHFKDLSTEELTKGLSVNRSKLCPLPADVLWAPIGAEGGKTPIVDSGGNFLFEKKERYYVLFCPMASINNPPPYKPNYNLRFSIKFAPVDYNLAHSLLFVEGINLSGLTKKEAKSENRDARFYVATLFEIYLPL